MKNAVELDMNCSLATINSKKRKGSLIKDEPKNTKKNKNEVDSEGKEYKKSSSGDNVSTYN